MATTDALLARLQSEADERNQFIDQLAGDAESAGRDLNDTEMGLIARARDRLNELGRQIDPLREAARVQRDSREAHAAIAAETAARTRLEDARRTGRVPEEVMYRSAGAYAIDAWRAGLGDEDARGRLGVFRRAAAHQTTADNLGIIPEPVVGPLLNFIDTSRPAVNTVGVTPMPGGRFVIPRITQHTDTGLQTAEKGELTSRKMLIDRVSVSMATYGGYVNVSRQDIDWSVPQIMDIVIEDLAGQYAIDTETATCAALKAGSTAQTPILTSTSTAAEVNAAVWKAVGTSYAATPGAAQFFLLVSPDMMGVIGPAFPSVNPTNANSSGFTAGNLTSGANGAISGVVVVMSYGLAAGTILLINGTAARCYEQRIGALQVTEPSVLGVQVAYAGYFQVSILVTGAIIKLTA